MAGRAAIITSGGRGIGRAITFTFSGEGSIDRRFKRHGQSWTTEGVNNA